MRQRPDKSALRFFLHVIDNGDQIFNFTKYTSVPLNEFLLGFSEITWSQVKKQFCVSKHQTFCTADCLAKYTEKLPTVARLHITA